MTDFVFCDNCGTKIHHENTESCKYNCSKCKEIVYLCDSCIRTYFFGDTCAFCYLQKEK